MSISLFRLFTAFVKECETHYSDGNNNEVTSHDVAIYVIGIKFAIYVVIAAEKVSYYGELR